MDNDLKDLAKLVSSYMIGDEINVFDIFTLASQIYECYGDELPNDLKRLCCDSLLYLERDFEENPTFKEYIEIGEELIEDLSGALGEYFA